MSPEPLVSIIIPAFKPQHLVSAITSVLEQTCADIEVLVGDDTPDGRLETIVTSVDDPQPVAVEVADGLSATERGAPTAAPAGPLCG